jgi:hypothetical protein
MPLDPQLDSVFDAAGRQFNVDPTLLKALTLTESSGRPNAVSPAGAQGLTQLMPGTAREVGVSNPFDPTQAIYGGAKYLAQGLDKYGDPVKALMYYHGGPDETQWGVKTQGYPKTVASYYGQLRGNGKSMEGIDALAAVGQPALNGPPTGIAGQANPQMAQAQPGGMSDEDILNGLATGRLPMPPGLAGPTPPPPQTSSQPGGLQQFGPEDQAWAREQSQLHSALGRQTPAWISDLAKLGVAQPLAAQTKAGENLQTVGPNGVVSNMPGAVESAAGKAGAVKEAEQVPIRTTEADKPIEQRGVGSSTLLTPGSPAAQRYVNAHSAGQPVPPGIRINPDGSVEVGNVNVPGETVNERYKELHTLQDEAHQARQGMFELGQLKTKLHEIGTSGPITEQLGQLSALAQQMGVPESTLKSMSLPPGAKIEEANKLSTDLLGAILHQTFPQRITNTDITAWKGTVPRANSLLEANDFLIDKIITPKFQRSIDRYGFAAGMSANDPQLTNYYKGLNDWDAEHPFNAYQIADQFHPAQQGSAPGAPSTPKRLRYNPDTQKLE